MRSPTVASGGRSRTTCDRPIKRDNPAPSRTGTSIHSLQGGNQSVPERPSLILTPKPVRRPEARSTVLETRRWQRETASDEDVDKQASLDLRACTPTAAIQPFISLPLVRIKGGWVGLAGLAKGEISERYGGPGRRRLPLWRGQSWWTESPAAHELVVRSWLSLRPGRPGHAEGSLDH
jgi:hypothetical protein